MDDDEFYKVLQSLPELALKQLRELVEHLKEKYALIEEVTNLSVPMDESSFWKFIDLIDWELADAYEFVRPLEEELAKRSKEDIYRFQDILAEKLNSLDGQEYLNAASKDIDVSSDSFLYARCFVVAQGENYYRRILNSPDEFSYRWFEPLLYTPNRAYLLKTGKELERFSPINYETGSNPNLWEEE